jgi:hypothetical protein
VHGRSCSCCLYDYCRDSVLEKVGDGGSSGMASQLCDRLGDHSKIYQERSPYLNVSCNAPVSRSGLRCPLPRAFRFVTDTDARVPAPSLCDCLQRSAVDNFSLPDKEPLRFSRRFSNNKSGVGGKFSRTHHLWYLPRPSCYDNCLNTGEGTLCADNVIAFLFLCEKRQNLVE